MADAISISGAVSKPLSLDAAALAADFAPVTVTVGSGNTAATYTGASVYSLISAAGFLYPTGAGVKNGALRDYVAVSAANGRQVVLSEGEIDPGFGGAKSTDIIAYSRDGAAIAPTLVVPGDTDTGTSGRDLGGVASLAVGVAAVRPALPGTPAASGLTLTGALPGAGSTYSAATLAQLGQAKQTDSFQAGTASTTATFTGVPAVSLLGSAGLDAAGLAGDYLVASGSDGYGVTYSGAEIDPSIRGGATALIAYNDGSGASPSVGGVSGALRTTAPGDAKGGRYVSILDDLTVSSPNADAVARLYLGALDRLPEASGSAFWTGLLGSSATLSQVADGILQSAEFQRDSGAGLSDAGFVGRLYQDMLGRAGEASGTAFWTGLLGSGVSRADVLVGFAGSSEAILHDAGAAGTASA